MFTWKLAYCENKTCRHLDIRSAADIAQHKIPVIDAEVPGNFELDMMRAGLLPDLFYAENTLLAQRLENLHLWYMTEFEITDPDTDLQFDGVDTVADIYVNGELAASHDNMFVGFTVSPNFRIGRNELMVHIKPACIEARRYALPPANNAMAYTFPSLSLRKAAHMFGWDIMPRIVSAGIWKPVSLVSRKPNRFRDVYITTTHLQKDGAQLNVHVSVDVDGDFITDYSVKITGRCRDSHFEKQVKLWHTDDLFNIRIDNPYLWWPRHAGRPDLYDTVLELYCGDTLCDRRSLSIGVRQIKLMMEEMNADGTGGEFCFLVNGKKYFAMGTNWVPLDAFHSRDEKRLAQALEMTDDIGCNIVRCWGGNVYESDAFYDFCDRHGILVWQDFAMGCGCYPNDDEIARKLEYEAVWQIKRLRNHPSLALWAGDNECDVAALGWHGVRIDPGMNRLTREVLKRAVAVWDYTREYLPSSPYVSEKSYREKLPLPEDHLWGPRDYFKGDYYRNATCHFASETGYHGFPAVDSLRTFLREPEKLFDENGKTTPEYLVHAACMETREGASFSYRIRLAHSQVVTLFGRAEDKLADFVKQSQISQAEAKKYFIERFRIGKWRRTGIIWWNLLDGWPQVSDAVVDYYFRRKLAYHYIKRAQAPVCLMFDEPTDGRCTLCAANDFPHNVSLTYRVIDTETNQLLRSGTTTVAADSTVAIDALPVADGEKRFYLIEWDLDGKTCQNHYVTNIKDIDYRWYLSQLERCGFDTFDGI